jgi:sugar phosphate permease
MIAGLVVPIILAAYCTEGWRFAWFYLGGAVLVIAGVAALLIRSRPEELGLNQVGETDGAVADTQAKTRATTLDWGSIYKMSHVWYLGFVYLLYGFSYVIYMTFFAAYLIKDMGVSAGEAGGMWSLVGGLSIFCGLIWGGMSDKLGRAWGCALAYLVLGMSYAVFALVQVKAGFYVSAVLFGLTAWSIPTIMAATAGDYVGPRLAPAGLGFVTLFFGIGQALGPYVGGYLADVTQSFVWPFLLACGVSFLGTGLSLRLKNTNKD